MEDKNDFAKALVNLRNCNSNFNDLKKIEAALIEVEKKFNTLQGNLRELSIARYLLVQFRNILAFGLNKELWPLPDIVPEDSESV